MTKETSFATKIEVGINNILGEEVPRVDEHSLAQAVRKLATFLDGEQRQIARYLAYALADALDNDDSYWKLKLSRSGVKGPHITADQHWKREFEDIDIYCIVRAQLDQGVKKEAAKQVAMDKYGRSASSIDDAIARLERRFTRMAPMPKIQ